MEQWISLLIQRREKALVNDIAAREKRIVTMNGPRKPLQFAVDDWVRVKSPNATKTALQVSDPRIVVEVSEDKSRYKVQNQSNGRLQWISISELMQSQAPDSTEETGSNSPDDASGSKAILVQLPNNQYRVVEDNPDLSDDTPRRVYRNARRSASRTQQKWDISGSKVKEYTVVERFTLDRNRAGNLTIPKWVVSRHRDVEIFRKA